jgi:hypothetical protein
MDAKEIINKIEKGEYKIEHASECGCVFDWSIIKNNPYSGRDELDDGRDVDECWEGMRLIVDDEWIAVRERFTETRTVFVDGLGEDDIPDEIWDKMGMSAVAERGESGDGEQHDYRRRASLIDWLMEGNYSLDRDDQRGFANEYTMILRANDQPVEITPERAAEWADDYLYAGDAATEAFVGLRIEEYGSDF